MFKDVPHLQGGEDTDWVATTLELMDRHNIEQAMVGVGLDKDHRAPGTGTAIQRYPDRFFGSYSVDPNRGMDGVRDLVKAYETMGIKAAIAFPAGSSPRCRSTTRSSSRSTRSASSSTSRSTSAPASAGRASRSRCQDTMLIDEVCWYFPELKFVMRHGCRAVGRRRRQAAAEVAEPLLLDLRVRADATTRRTSSTSRTAAAPTR